MSKQGSKTENLKIEDTPRPSSYLFSRKLNVEEIQTLFKLRTRTIDVKGNQESSFKDNLWCRKCHMFPESQKHIFECQKIRKQLDFIEFRNLKYEMIFGQLEGQELFAKNYHLMLNAMSDLTRTSPSTMEDHCTGSVADVQQIVLCV